MFAIVLSNCGFVLACGLIGALGFRWAGGLLSQWAGRDLGDFVPRQLWGLTVTLPVIPLAIRNDIPLAVKVLALVTCSILTGLCRGVGWGNSLSLGFTEIGRPTHATFRQAAIMCSRLAAMTIVPFATALILGPHSMVRTAVLLFLYVLVVLASTQTYIEAWIHGGLQLPWLGCIRRDPPPSGELATGYIAGAFLAAYAL